MTDPLTRLAIQYGTDKFGYHDYTPVYFRLLNERREAPLKFLEIGVGGYGDADRGGESLMSWRDFFPKGEIVGIDIQKKTLDLGERVTVLQGSQVDADFLSETVREHGPFDIILDDGSHRNEHVIESFKILWPDLKPDGIYIVEDLQTAFFPRFGGSLELDEPNSVGYFAELFQTFDLPDLAGMARFHNIVVLYKTSAPPLIPGHGEVQTVHAPAAELGEAVRGAVGTAPADGIVCATSADESPAPEIFRTWFVDVDHREKAVFFPEAESAAEAEGILGLFRTSEGWRVEKGDNTYPSNFRFESDHPRVIETFDAMREVLADSQIEGGLTNFADMLVRADRLDEARPYVERLLNGEGTSRKFFALGGRVLKEDEKWAEAASLLERAVERFPDDLGFWINYASSLSRSGDEFKAVEALETAATHNPRAAAVRRSLASAMLRVQRVDEAVEQAELAVKLNPKNAGFRLFLANLKMRAGEDEEALGIIQAAISLDPNDPKPHVALVGCLSKLGRDAEAGEARQKAEALSQM
ncbi:tetratricopeptide repeat protein [Aestuariibius sp. 2305UL40-4]|uniref:tetratricopeptide repeat protein n=1 Tax=Aestuariibius violaceus TaxID=3234132 RepID=UPI00345E982C